MKAQLMTRLLPFVIALWAALAFPTGGTAATKSITHNKALARDLLVEAESMVPRLGRELDYVVSDLYARIGAVYYQLGDEAEGERLLRQAVRSADRLDDPLSAAITLSYLLFYHDRLGLDPQNILDIYDRRIRRPLIWAWNTDIHMFSHLDTLVEAGVVSARIGRPEFARRLLETAEQLTGRISHSHDDGGAGFRFQLLCGIAGGYALMKDDDTANRVIAKAQKLAADLIYKDKKTGRQIDERTRHLPFLVEALGLAGRDTEALALASSLKHRESALRTLATAQARRGDLDAALSTLSNVTDPQQLVYARQSLAPIFARHDRLAEALDQIQSLEVKVGTLDSVLSARAALGDVDGVRQALARYPIVKKPHEYLLEAYLRRGDLAAIESIPEGEFSVERARLLLRQGRVEEAMRIADQLRATSKKLGSYALVELAVEAARLPNPIDLDPVGRFEH
jgi:tetratricopeptide (TPR) repeat protein